MANMSPKKNPIPEQDPNVRNKNFEEVALGYTVEMAVDEANRCLNCPRPACMSGCPVNVKIPQFIARVREQDFKGAYHKILEDSSLPAICGRVCPQEKQCESKCVRGIKGEPVGIGRLERFVADWNRENADEMPEKIATNGHRVAVIGSGPSGLACASDLAKLGYDVTVYEHFHKAGGVLAYGIPEFRLPKAIVQKEIDKLVAMGVNIVCDATIGKCMSIDELPGTSIGRRRPFSSGSPSSIRMHLRPRTQPLSSARISTGLHSRWKLMPSSFACSYSSLRAGISSSPRRYTTVTSAPRRLAQRAASMATLPAPTTAVTWMGISGVS